MTGTEHAAIDLTIDSDLVRQALTDFIRGQMDKAGVRQVLVGLSGGLDSALVCSLAAEALGPKNVLAVRMPYRTSSPDSLAHAQLVIDQLGVESDTVAITEMADALIERTPGMDRTRRGNIMARLRMIVLYDLSAARQGLVIGTGNKTEILLGYSTLFGDSACAFNPVGDLYKTQVRQLARALGVPEPVIAKAPSADLFSGQTDEGDLGFTYAEVDQLLHLLADRKFSPEACVQAGFAPEMVEAVVRRVERYAFKRTLPPIAQLPPGALIGQNTLA